MNALLVVDIQNDFLPGGALAVPEGDRIIPTLNRLQPHFDLVVGTQDWHPADHGSFAANHPGRAPGEIIELDGIPQILWPVHCVQGTVGADFAPGLDRQRWSEVFQKGTNPMIDSYSGFYDNEHLQSTHLNRYLRKMEVTDVYVAGLATDYCVKYTVLDALDLGFDTHIVHDACRGVNLGANDSRDAIEVMREAGATIISAETILS